MLQYKKIDLSEGIDSNKASALNVCLCHFGTLKMLHLNLSHMFVINVTMH